MVQGIDLDEKVTLTVNVNDSTWLVCLCNTFGDRQGSLACCSPWSHKESNTKEWQTWTEQHLKMSF